MKIRLTAIVFWTAILLSLPALSQDFSNKGKEFWLSYSYHVSMIQTGGGSPQMTLYITSDENTNYTVEIFGLTTIQAGAIAAGQVVSVPIPNNYYVNNEGLFVNKAIRVTTDKPSVVYSYITRSAISGATLCLPTNVLGREYYATGFTQVSNEPNSNSYFTIIAVEDNTTVEIIPSAKTKNGWLANSVNTITLNKGQIYQVLGVTTGLTGDDLTGSIIRSVAGGAGGCKRIAVFSGSGKVSIGCNTPESSDNLYQQLYPVASWGKKYLTLPSFNHPNNYYRVIKSDPAANVYVNGVLIPASSFVNNYYQFFTNAPRLIESDKPISVAQYFTTQNCAGNSNPTDPDMIILNPVEQNIDKVTLVNSNLYANTPPAHQHHIHVIMRNGGTGTSSFTIDGSTVPASSWTTHPSDPNYSYLYLSNVSQGYHRLASDSGFNAIAYGYAGAESYGYSAGANVKDLYQFVSVQNQYATVNFPAACRASPFFFSMTFPYQPTQIRWQFGGLFPDVLISSPVYDSTWNINGKQLYKYKLPTPYTINTLGTYPIKVLAQNPSPDGCSGDQEINYDLQVFERPQADFSFNTTGCVTDSVKFFDNTNTNGRPAINWSWNFGDGGFSGVKNPVHFYTQANSYQVKYSVITDIGCLSDTISKTVLLTQPPLAKFGISTPNCINKTISFTDSSTVINSSIVKWYWDFGDGTPQIISTTNAAQSHTYTNTGTYTVTLKVENAVGCQSLVFSKQVTINPKPVVDFNFGNACLPAGTMQFNNTSTIAAGSMNYKWDFGDGGNSFVKDPSHNFNTTGPFQVKLVATSTAGCMDSITKAVNTIYAQPVAIFTAPSEVCTGSVAGFSSQSTAPNSSVSSYQWFFGDGGTSNVQDPSHTYQAAGSYQVKLVVTSAIGCTSDTARKTVIVNPLPSALFNTSVPACVTRDIIFTDGSIANAGNIIKWTWDLGDGSSQVANNNSPVTHNYGATGNYNVSLTVETDKGCIGPALTKPVTIHPLPVPGFIMPGICLTDPYALFIDTSSIADGSGSQFTYSWNFGDPNANMANPNTSTLKDPQHKYIAVGSYDVTLTVRSNAGCVASLTKLFSVNGTQPQSIFSVNGGNQHCSNETVSITDHSIVDVGNLVRLEIYWDYANDPTIKSIHYWPAPGAGYSHDYPEFFDPVTKDVVIMMVAYSGDNCLHSSSQTITLKATPQINFSPIPGICADQEAFAFTQATLLNNLQGSGAYTGNGITNGLFDPQLAGNGAHTIRYTYQSSNGCSNYKEQIVNVYPVPLVDAGPDRFVLQGGNAVLAGSGSGTNINYSWSPATWLNDAGIAQPVVTPQDDMTYTLTVTSSDNCSASDQVVVKFLREPAIPNTFSPNGDGVHDKWLIKYLESYPGATVEIFNRYGQPVFKSVGYSTPWDGTYKGKPLPAGTYYYLINPKNGRKQMSGFVDIIR